MTTCCVHLGGAFGTAPNYGWCVLKLEVPKDHTDAMKMLEPQSKSPAPGNAISLLRVSRGAPVVPLQQNVLHPGRAGLTGTQAPPQTPDIPR